MESDADVTVSVTVRGIPHRLFMPVAEVAESYELETFSGEPRMDGLFHMVVMRPMPLTRVDNFLQEIRQIMVDDGQPID